MVIALNESELIIIPQGRVTDHRINLTLYKLSEVMEGELEAIIDPLVIEQQTNQLTALNESL